MAKKRKKLERKSFIVPMVNRHYNVRVVVSKRTGKVLVIYAGCRDWKSFDEALAHYAGKGPYDVRRRKMLSEIVSGYEAERQGRKGDFDNRTYSLIALCRAAGLAYRYQCLCKKRAKRVSRKRRL